MYTSFYGLTGKPFSLIPDPGVVFMSETHREALSILQYGLIDRKGFLLLTGDVGTGKTTLVQALIHSLDNSTRLCHIANPTLTQQDFYRYVAAQLNLAFDNKAQFILDFADLLKSCRQKDERILLIIDEAHAMAIELLEEIRLLSNQLYEEYGILGIFLVGQPELNLRLNEQRLLPLLQRIGIRFHMKPFNDDETREYIHFRLKQVGGDAGKIFTEAAIALIHTASNGVPRLINVLCDHAMLSGFAASTSPIDENIMQECIEDFNFLEPYAPTHALAMTAGHERPRIPAKTAFPRCTTAARQQAMGMMRQLIYLSIVAVAAVLAAYFAGMIRK